MDSDRLKKIAAEFKRVGHLWPEGAPDMRIEIKPVVTTSDVPLSNEPLPLVTRDTVTLTRKAYYAPGGRLAGWSVFYGNVLVGRLSR